MNGIHPKLNLGASCFLAAALFAIGCRSTSSGVNNPFMAPDRVAPPSTRVLAPGQAQPYYQGDPLPVTQSAPGASTGGPLTADTAARSASGATLAWNAPASGAPSAPTTASSPPPWGVTPQASTPIARANEGAVSVPTDSNSLRFALPTSGTAPSAVANAAPTNQGVSLASYNTPAANGLTPVGTAPVLSPTPQQNAMWQSPQMANVNSSITGYAQGPQVIPTNPMAVDLRSVSSPPPQPGDPMPRIRVPGSDVPETAANDSFHARTSMR